MYQLQEKLEYQEQKCKVLYDWIQENIGSFKTEITAIETVSCISTRNIPLLTHLYKIMCVFNILILYIYFQENFY